MPAQTETRSGLGLQHSWPLGESGWDTGMNANLLAIARFGVHVSVKDRDLAAPPSSPTLNDTYIVAASPTGAWAGKASQIALWDGTVWVFSGPPRLGWVAYVEDEEKLTAYKTTGWSVGVAI